MVMHDKALKSPDMKSLVTKLQKGKGIGKKCCGFMRPESAKNLPLLSIAVLRRSFMRRQECAKWEAKPRRLADVLTINLSAFVV